MQSGQQLQLRCIMHTVWSSTTVQIYHEHSLISTNSANLSGTESDQQQLSDLSCTQSGHQQQFRFIMNTVWSAPTQQLIRFITTQIYQARSKCISIRHAVWSAPTVQIYQSSAGRTNKISHSGSYRQANDITARLMAMNSFSSCRPYTLFKDLLL